MKALNEIKASLGWRVVYAWVGDDPCGDGDLPPWSGVTCSTQGDYRVVTELYAAPFLFSLDWNSPDLRFIFEGTCNWRVVFGFTLQGGLRGVDCGAISYCCDQSVGSHEAVSFLYT